MIPNAVQIIVEVPQAAISIDTDVGPAVAIEISDYRGIETQRSAKVDTSVRKRMLVIMDKPYAVPVDGKVGDSVAVKVSHKRYVRRRPVDNNPVRTRIGVRIEKDMGGAGSPERVLRRRASAGVGQGKHSHNDIE